MPRATLPATARPLPPCSFACKPLHGGEYAPCDPDAARQMPHMAYEGRSANRGRRSRADTVLEHPTLCLGTLAAPVLGDPLGVLPEDRLADPPVVVREGAEAVPREAATAAAAGVPAGPGGRRSEERRVGKEC